MFSSCFRKQNEIKLIFENCLDQEAKYQKIIELGREAKGMDPKYKLPSNLVKGCQSIIYLHASLIDGNVYFEAESEALITAGLAMILIKAYNGETPETILKCPPKFLEEMGLAVALSPNRANGLYSIHLKIKQEALKFLVQLEKQE